MARSFHHHAQRPSQESFTWLPATRCYISSVPPSTFCIFMFCAALLISGNFRRSTLLCCVMHLQGGSEELDPENIFKYNLTSPRFSPRLIKHEHLLATVESFFFSRNYFYPGIFINSRVHFSTLIIVMFSQKCRTQTH